MTVSAWRLREAASHIQSGSVIACPAEAMWGLSCDPWRLSAVAALCRMKQRALSKGVIVASCDARHFDALLEGLSEEQRNRVLLSWPGPTTWLIPNNGVFPNWVTGESKEVAIRVTSAPALSGLCRELGGPVVTTSANWAGAQPAKHLFQVKRYFGPQIATIPGVVNLSGRPSTIKRATTGDILR